MKTFLAGLAAGVVLGLMFAPESRTSRRIRGWVRPKPYQRRYLWREPENRLASAEREERERTLDKTIADSFPASDPPSSIPDPSEDSLVA